MVLYNKCVMVKCLMFLLFLHINFVCPESFQLSIRWVNSVVLL